MNLMKLFKGMLAWFLVLGATMVLSLVVSTMGSNAALFASAMRGVPVSKLTSDAERRISTARAYAQLRRTGRTHAAEVYKTFAMGLGYYDQSLVDEEMLKPLPVSPQMAPQPPMSWAKRDPELLAQEEVPAPQPSVASPFPAKESGGWSKVFKVEFDASPMAAGAPSDGSMKELAPEVEPASEEPRDRLQTYMEEWDSIVSSDDAPSRSGAAQAATDKAKEYGIAYSRTGKRLIVGDGDIFYVLKGKKFKRLEAANMADAKVESGLILNRSSNSSQRTIVAVKSKKSRRLSRTRPLVAANSGPTKETAADSSLDGWNLGSNSH